MSDDIHEVLMTCEELQARAEAAEARCKRLKEMLRQVETAWCADDGSIDNADLWEDVYAVLSDAAQQDKP